MKSILSLSTLCDPRFRNFVNEDSKMKIFEKIVAIYKKGEDLENKNSESNTPPPAKKIKKGLAKFSEDDETDLNSLNDPSLKAEEELKHYLSMPKVDFEKNPLNWWGKHQDSFPSLKILAKIYLAVQGSSVASERVFSAGG